jgi:hypothetical protein
MAYGFDKFNDDDEEGRPTSPTSFSVAGSGGAPAAPPAVASGGASAAPQRGNSFINLRDYVAANRGTIGNMRTSVEKPITDNIQLGNDFVTQTIKDIKTVNDTPSSVPNTTPPKKEDTPGWKAAMETFAKAQAQKDLIQTIPGKTVALKNAYGEKGTAQTLDSVLTGNVGQGEEFESGDDVTSANNAWNDLLTYLSSRPQKPIYLPDQYPGELSADGKIRIW